MVDRFAFEQNAGNEQLLARMRAGDVSAFEAVILAYHDRLAGYLSRAGVTKDTADDLLQELYLRLWRNRETLPPRAALDLYLHTAIRHRLLDHVRSERRFNRAAQRYGDQAALMGVPFANGDEDTIDIDELERGLHRAVEKLPPRMQEVWRLHREQGLSYTQVGVKLGISVNTVKTQMRRALEAVRETLRSFR